MSAEYPRWIYPSEGGPGKLIHTPDHYLKGWQDVPATAQSAIGERIIGQPLTHVVLTSLVESVAAVAEEPPKKIKK